MRGWALGLLLDAAWAHRGGRAPLRRRQRQRLAEMVRFARARSPYYRELYQGLPGHVEDPGLLPVTDKKRLMARFDDWVTDRGVTLERAREFVASPGRVGEWFLGRHTLATTSGTTGSPGLFVLDARSFAVAGAMGFRMLSSWLGRGDLLRVVRGGGRLAMMSATGGHYASAVAAARLGRRRGRVLALSVERPLPELAARLEEFQPAVLAPYASAAALLAGEQEQGRLHLRPVLVVLSAEGLPLPEYERIARAFGARVRHSYAATECPFLSFSCAEGWLHVNSDWAILEPVDREGWPVPPGETSHTVLLTNLANRVQPILRYDLGDRVLVRPDPCPCGSVLPALRVQGRAADLLPLSSASRGTVRVPALALELDLVSGVELFQVVQTGPAALRVRLRLVPGAGAEGVWSAVLARLRSVLAGLGLGQVEVERAAEPPEPSAAGKVRPVIPLVLEGGPA